MKEDVNKYNLGGGILFIFFGLIIFEFPHSITNSVLAIINIIVGLTILIISYKFPELLRRYNISKKQSQEIAEYDKTLELNSNDTKAWNNKGTVFAEFGNYHEALKCFDKVLEIDPKDGGAWHNKGVTLDNLRKPQEAIKHYDNALTLDPKLKQAKQSGKIILER